MAEKIETLEGLFGEKIHYRDGEKIGESWPGLLGGSYDHYDAQGNPLGSSEPGLFADLEHYDARGEHVGSTQRGLLGTWEHYDREGHWGTTNDTLWGETTWIDEER